LKEVFEEMRVLGVRGTAFRLSYEFLNRSGLRGLCEPVRDISGDPAAEVPLAQWRQEAPPFLIRPDSLPAIGKCLAALLSEEGKRNLLEGARDALDGRIRCFSRWTADFGSPIDWHRNPLRGVSWPPRAHWSKALSFEPSCGDVKITWEANRFLHLFSLVRAYALSGDSAYVEGFTGQLRSWEKANKYRAGVNWSSGQELAVRAVSWIFALYSFAEDSSLAEEDFRRLVRLLRLHGEHIARHIGFSRFAVHNNHLIGEALALYLIGGCFAQLPEARRWREKGRSLLEGECLRQFLPDGGYCQASHTYHRLALHYYLWACRLGELWGDPFPAKVYRIMAASGEFLASFLNPADGRLPNWGPNDGALLNPWTSCDFTDFRPVIGSVAYLVSRRRVFSDGPWDEELLWFFGPEALLGEEGRGKTMSVSFPDSGLHVLRTAPDDFAVLRCGSVTDRFGQADQLHVDLWWRGINIGMDGGSYLYNDELTYHQYFMGTRSHNTVMVDGRDQMLLHRRFKWLYWTEANLVEWSPEGERDPAVEGEHFGYRRAVNGPVVHPPALAARRFPVFGHAGKRRTPVGDPDGNADGDDRGSHRCVGRFVREGRPAAALHRQGGGGRCAARVGLPLLRGASPRAFPGGRREGNRSDPVRDGIRS
jgi:asparagine synthase (glutamine-hydrolysing)